MSILEFALIALGLFYIVIAILSAIRLFKVATSHTAIKIAIAFYSGMLLASITRAVTLYLISENMILPTDSNINTTYFIFIYLMVVMPDMLNICVYLFLIWYFYANFILSHINLANDLRLFSQDDIPTISSKTYIMLYITVPVYTTVFVLVCLLTFCDVLGNEALYLINAYFNLVTPVLFFAYYIFLLVKLSGRPYINQEMKSQVNRILVIVIIWSVARMVTGILGIINSGSFFDNIINDFKNKSDDLYYAMTILVYLIVTEYVPNFFALDYTFMMTYIQKRKKLIDEEDIEGTSGSGHFLFNSRKVSHYTDVRSSDQLVNEHNLVSGGSASKDLNHDYQHAKAFRSSMINPNNNQAMRTSSVNINEKKTIKDFIIKFNDIQLQDLLYQRKNGLGSIYKAQYMNKEVCCRVVKFDRLSRYDLEGLSKDMEELANIQHQYVCPHIGLCVENIPNIYVLWPFYKNGSLYDLLHVQKIQLDLKSRLEMAKKIAIGMDCLQENMIYHYHLSSRNIYIQEDLTPRIADYGFHYLKDISSVFIKYKNKNSYTSPELLKETKIIGNTTSNNDNFYQSDVYSFGILLWELYIVCIPFNISLSNVYNYVVINGYRPETKDFHPSIVDLLRQCWDSDPLKRPTFKKIIELLDNSIKLL